MRNATATIQRMPAGDYCAFIGDNPEHGIAGYGGSPSDALRALAFELEAEGYRSEIPAVQELYRRTEA